MKRILRLISFTILLVMMMAVIVNADTSTNGPTVQEFTFDASLQDMTLWYGDADNYLVSRAGTPAVFSVVATGDGPLTYQWQSKGSEADAEWTNIATTDASGVNSATLTILDPRKLHYYRCIITDINGKQVIAQDSRNRALMVCPGFSMHPQNTYASLGETAQLEVELLASDEYVEVTDWKLQAVRWFFDVIGPGKYVDTSSGSRFSYEDGGKRLLVKVDSENVYGKPAKCEAYWTSPSRGYSLWVSSNIGYIEDKPFSIDSSPENANIVIGGQADFSVDISGGFPPYTYQWQSRKDPTSAWTNSGVTGADTDTISVKATAGLSGYQFRCVVMDDAGTKLYSDAATLMALPKISIQPKDTTVTVGDVAQFKVTAIGKATLEYQWQSRKNAESAWSNSGQTGSKTDTLSVTTSAGLNGYQFRCVVTDGAGQIIESTPATLTINPKIISQPTDVSITSGSVAKYSVVASGRTPFTYQWQSRKNAESTWANSGQTGSKTATLSVTASPGMDGYQFRCLVTDANGRTTYSDEATLSILLSISAEPTDASATIGSVAMFTVGAKGKAPLTYQWQLRKDASADWVNSTLDSARNSTLSVAASIDFSGYQYRCVVSDGSGQSIYSEAATLTIIPAITAQPANASVTAGSNATFTVSVSGIAPFSYQWQSRKNEDATWANSGLSSAKSETLSVTASNGLDGYQFRCIVTDGNGQQVCSDATTVFIIPTITTQPKNASVIVGATATFTVTASGKTPLTYQWQSRKNADATWANSGLSSAKTSTLTLTPTAGYDGYQFRCVVTGGNGLKTYSNAATITILPSITSQPQNVSVAAGSTATFTVAASGKTPFTYQWQSRKNADATWANSGLASAKSATLTLTPTAGYDGYQFRCVLTDANGQKVYSEAATLSILLNITTQPKDVGVTVGTTAKFTVAATGKATLTYQWQSRKNADTAWANSGVTGAKTATMSLTPTAGYHGYQFRCVITDGNGQKVYSDPATLFIVPAISTQPQNASAKAGSTVTFTVAATGKAPFTYQWQSRKNSDAAWANSGLSTAKQATLSVTASPGMAGYQFRCVVTDSNGQKAYSNGAVLSVLLNITSQPANASTTVGSTAKFTVAATGKATLSYQWQSRKDSSSSWANSGLSTAKEATLVVTASAGLDGYQFRCAITDGYGKTTYSNAATLSVNLSITTQPQNASAAIGSTAQFTVAAAGKATLTYQWQSRKDSSSSWANSGLSSAKNATLSVTSSAGLDGYQFRCVVTDGNGKKVYSNAATLTIELSITSHPKNVSSVDGGAAVFSVTAVGGAPLSYQWQYKANTTASWVNLDESWAKTTSISINAHSGIDGYQFRCMVTDRNGNKVYSDSAYLSIQIIPGLDLPHNAKGISSNGGFFLLDDFKYILDGNRLVIRMSVTRITGTKNSSCYFRLIFYDKNGRVVKDKLFSETLSSGYSAYIEDYVYTTEINGAVRAVYAEI